MNLAEIKDGQNMAYLQLLFLSNRDVAKFGRKGEDAEKFDLRKIRLQQLIVRAKQTMNNVKTARTLIEN